MAEFDELLRKFESPDESAEAPDDHPEILVVDDEESIRRALSRSFADAYIVVTAENGDESVEKINPAIHCVILDVKMQGNNGFTTYPKLKEKSPDVPIIFYTAFQSEHDLIEVINRFKPEGYMEKGRDFTFLQNLVNNAVQKYRLVLENQEHHKNLEKKVQERTRELEETHRQKLNLEQQLRIQEVMRTGEDIGAQILHDCKNLLQPVGNYIQRTKRLTNTCQQLLQIAEQEKLAERDLSESKIQNLIANVTSSQKNAELAYNEILSSYEDFRQAYNPRENGLNNLCKDLDSSINLIIDRNYRAYIQVERDYQTQKVPKTYDSTRINKGVFMNLIKNARDAIEARKKSEGADYEGFIRIATREEAGKTVVSIYDNGIGIPEGCEEKIFEKKFTTKTEGTGLGLFNVRFILHEMQCGDVYCAPSDNEKYTTRFVIDFPLGEDFG